MGYNAFLERMGEVNDLLNAQSILSWDSRTMMPPGGAETRAKQMATLTVFARDLLVADETRRLLDRAEAETAHLPEDGVERIAKEVRGPVWCRPHRGPRRAPRHVHGRPGASAGRRTSGTARAPRSVGCRPPRRRGVLH